MPSTFSLLLSKWALDVAAKLIKADLRLHNAEVIEDDMAIIFTVNHFTRLETALLPYTIHRHTGLEVMSLAADELFQGPVGEFLESAGAVSTKNPGRDTIIVHSLLKGEHPWIIFPEGAMIKDKKVVDPKGDFQVWSDSGRRPPHTGAAVLALRAEFYRHKIECIHNRPEQKQLDEALAMFGLDSVEEVLRRRTVIIPVNITYFPIRAHDNLALRIASRLSEGLGKRAVEELSVEGTVISEDTDIDITLGTPIDVRQYLDAPEYAGMMACGLNDMSAFEADSHSEFNNAARKLMRAYMARIYELTTVNYDHLFAAMLRYYPGRNFTERGFRNRCFLSAQHMMQLEDVRVHDLLASTYRDLVYEDANPKFDDFLLLCLEEGAARKEGRHYTKAPPEQATPSEASAFHSVRREELAGVIANEAEPLTSVVDAIRRAARLPHFLVLKRVRDFFLREDKRLFDEDYTKYYDAELSKGPDVGRPFLLKPVRVRGGVVLAHGYLAAPLEIHALANALYRQGYAVYGVRLRGHGTSPDDLAQRSWHEWYESFNRGYAVLKTLTDNLYVGGFSTGGCLALIAAARKTPKVQGVFSICAPLKLQNYSVRLAPSIVTLNALLKRIGADREGWEFVDNDPENKHINYTRNPLAGVTELTKVMNEMDQCLPEVNVPALVVQASKDPTVNPDSASLIFERLGTRHKELSVFERERHGIVNGEGAEDIFLRVHQFLERAPKGAAGTESEDEAAEG